MELNDMKKQKQKETDPQQKTKSTSFAAGVTYKEDEKSKPKQFCSLCSNESNKVDSHSIINCPFYKTPKDKLDKLESVNGCKKCGYTNHITTNCKFRFQRRCRNCSSWHFVFLCTKETNLNDRAQGNDDKPNSQTAKEKQKEPKS